MKILDSISNNHIIQLSDRTYIDNDGYLVCKDAIFGRVGIQQYLKRELGMLGNPNEAVEVYRKPEYIFDEESLETLDGKPLTLGHPKVKVTIDNYQEFAKGFVQNVRHDEKNIYGDIRITDKKVRKIVEEKQMRELSLGYDMVLIQDETNENIFYCKDIVYNHLALVKQGRAGNAMILDSNESNFEERGNEEVAEVLEKEVNKEEEVVDENKEVKEEEKEKDKEEVKDNEAKAEEPKKEETEKADDACKDEEGKEEKQEAKDEKENKKMTFLDRALEIEKIKDADLKQALKNQLFKDMGVNIVAKDEVQKEEKTKVEINDTNIKDAVSHEERMQAYYDSFDPHLYGNDCNSKEYKDAMKDKTISTRLEDAYRQYKINKK